ncbi:MAG: AAA family ATPase [Planctomycetota bacterium]
MRFIRDDTRPETIVIELLRRGHRYADGCGAANEGGRNNATFALAGHLWSLVEYASTPGTGPAYGLNEAEIMEVLHAWNARDPSPLDDTEVEAVCRSTSVNGIPRPPKPARRRSAVGGRPVLVNAADVVPELVRWAWQDWLARGKVTLVGGDPGLGKSFITYDLAARFSVGGPTPDGKGRFPRCGVLLASAEDDPRDTSVPRLIGAGADLKRIRFFGGIQAKAPDPGPGPGPGPGNIPLAPKTSKNAERDAIPSGGTDRLRLDLHMDQLDQAIRDTPDCGFVVIDPITSYLGDADSNSNAEVRVILDRLGEIAARRGVVILVVTHLRKNTDSRGIYRFMGSLGFVAAVRTAWGVTEAYPDDPDDKTRRVAVVKNNVGADGHGLHFEIFEAPESPHGACTVRWGEPFTAGRDEAMGGDVGRGRSGGGGLKPTKIALAGQWLQVYLRQGPEPASDVREAGERFGHRYENLAKAIDKVGWKEKLSFDGRWVWGLSGQPKPASTPSVAPPDTSETG